MTKKAMAIAAVEALRERYPDAVCSLTYTDPLQLLIATRLSAQCTDARVNLVTPALFERYPTLDAFADASPEEVGEYIRSCGLYKTKARDIVAMAGMLRDVYHGEIPQTVEELIKLPGVGRKTANVVVSNAFGTPAIAVDTHVFRIAHKLKLVGPSADTPQKTEDALLKLYPKQYWGPINHQWVLFGRQTCIARRPKCTECFLSDLCPSSGR